ncbi:hypothetical protein FQA39_LY16209 [Lamprigera yunnana]|nr:hypothetical protein FQA39_LY16209 [Lamprigera yunnana]
MSSQKLLTQAELEAIVQQMFDEPQSDHENIFDADTREDNVVADQTIDLPWSIPEDYNMNDETRLLAYGIASEETLINSSKRYDLDNEGKYIEMGYSTHLELQPVIRIRDGAIECADARCNARFNKKNVLLNIYEREKFMALKSHILNHVFYDSAKIQKVLDQSSGDELSIQNMGKTENITEDVKILYHWEYSEGLSSPMMPTIAMTASDPMRNGDNFMKTITLQRDYRTCTFNRYNAEAIFQLKPIINYRLELMRSWGLKGFYDNIVKYVIIQKSKREEIRRMAGININDFQVYGDGGAYEIFKQTLNSKYNINSYNVLCGMDMYRHRPVYILNDIIANR